MTCGGRTHDVPFATATKLWCQAEADIARLRAALAVYADPKHWAIRRNGTMYADCIWIGPGATDRVNPDGPGIARAALEEPRVGVH